MKTNILAVGLCVSLSPLLTFGGEKSSILSEDLGFGKGGPVPVDPPRSPSNLRIGLGFAPLLGVDAEFSGLGTFNNPLTPQPLGGGQNYTYDNGFVRVDSTGNAGGDTWNWGYNNGAQYDPAGGGSISQSISNGVADGEASGSDDFAPGVEAFAYWEMGEVPGLSFGGGPSRWGLKATLHYASISIDDSGTISASVNRTTDTFQLNGVNPPAAPYAGTFNGPGPAISDSPTRATAIVAGGASVAGTRDVELDLFSLTVGPYLEIPISPAIAVSAEAGFSLAIADGDYRFRSTTSIAGVGTQTTTGSENESKLLPGFAAGLTAMIRLNDAWSAYAGARYQYYDSMEINAGASEAELDFGGAFILSVGATYSY